MADFITLSCPSCGAKINVVPGTDRYKCEYCGSEQILNNPAVAQRAALSAARPAIPTPDSVVMQRDRDALRLTRRWFSWKYIPMAFFCVAWDSFLIFWYGMAFSTKAPWIMIVFPIAHLAVGIGLTYSTICGFFNRTILEVTPQELAVWNDPFPWMGEVSVNTRDLKQLYCKETTTNTSNGTTRSYQLYGLTQNDRTVKLMPNLDTPDIALYIEQQVETWLRIKDQPVSGELPRT